jgi:hypothetical protein
MRVLMKMGPWKPAGGAYMSRTESGRMDHHTGLRPIKRREPALLPPERFSQFHLDIIAGEADILQVALR